MLNIITNILLTVMSILSSSNVLVTNLEQNQIESQQLMNVLISTEENDIDRLLANPPEKIEIEVKYKIDVTVMEGVSQTILKKVILVLLKISRMIKSKCTFRFSGGS